MSDTDAASHITDHPFVPKGEWYTLCKKCGIAEAAHKETSLKESDRNLAERAVELEK